MKLVAVFAEAGADLRPLAEGMLRAQRWASDDRMRLWPVEGGVLGCVEGGDRCSRLAFAREGEGGNLLLLSGTPISLDGPLDALLSSCLEGTGAEAARLLKSLHGAYAALFWDARAKMLTVVTDELGQQPLHLHRDGGRLLLSTDLKGITAANLLKVEPNPRAWASFLSMGCSHDAHTLVTGVERAMPARVITYRPEAGRLDEETYWQPPRHLRPDMPDEAFIEELGVMLKADIRAYHEHADTTQIMLSGGFDSRLLASLLHGEGYEPSAVVLRHDDENANLDGRMAMAVARRLGLPVRELPFDPDYFSSEDYRRYLWMSELCNTSFGLFISYLWTGVMRGPKAVWDGLAVGCLTKDMAKGAASPEALLGSAVALPGKGRLWRAAARMLSPEFLVDLADGFADLRRHVTEDFPQDAQGAQAFMLSARMRHRISQNPYRVLSNGVLPMTPGLSRPFIETMLSVPQHHKRGLELAARLQRVLAPGLTDIPIAHGSTLTCANDAPGAAFRLERLRLQVLDQRLTHVARRLLGRRPVHMPVTSPIVADALTALAPDDPMINADELRKLQKADLTASYDDAVCGQLVLYLSEFRRLFGDSGPVAERVPRESPVNGRSSHAGKGDLVEPDGIEPTTSTMPL